MPTVAMVTDEASLPIDYDMPLLLDACHEIGLTAEVCFWDNPGVDWSSFDAALLRSPWTYVDRLQEFLTWCELVSDTTSLFNPLPAARWSLDKRYMADLAGYGVPVVPSTFAEPGADPLSAVREFLAAHRQAGEFVVKPTVGAYSKDVQRFTRPLEAEAVQHVAKLHAAGFAVLLQPYFAAIDRDGETDLVYFDGVYSHAIRKSAMLMPDGTVNVPTFESRQARAAGDDERVVASAVLEAATRHLGLEQPLVYARIDLVRLDDGTPLVLEMELCEPSLNLPFAEGSAKRFAQAVVQRLKA